LDFDIGFWQSYAPTADFIKGLQNCQAGGLTADYVSNKGDWRSYCGMWNPEGGFLVGPIEGFILKSAIGDP
jgi:hypothetical protein